MTLIERRLRGLEEQARRAGRKICGLQLQLRGRIESDAAQSLGTCPPIHRGRRNGLVKGTQRRRRWNLRQKLGRIFVAGSKLVQAQSRMLAEISFRKTLRGHAEITASMGRASSPLGATAKPVKCVGRIGRDRVLAKERDEFAVGVRLAIQVGDPGNAPLAVVSVFPGGKIVENALIVGSGLAA